MCERRGLALGAWVVPVKEGQHVGTRLQLPHSYGPGGPGTTEIVIQSQWTGYFKEKRETIEGMVDRKSSPLRGAGGENQILG